MTDIKITERVFKNFVVRTADTSPDVTKVIIDTRSSTHDVVTVEIRGLVAGQLVTNKFDSVTIARRLIPDTLRYGMEPQTFVADAEKSMHCALCQEDLPPGTAAQHMRENHALEGILKVMGESRENLIWGQPTFDLLDELRKILRVPEAESITSYATAIMRKIDNGS